ncbi:TPA: MFS transporter [Klebsiella oxytoca]
MNTRTEAEFHSNKKTHVRFLILFFIFIITAISYADRVALSIVGSDLIKEMNLDVATLGRIFSAFGIAYMLMQIPGGYLLDRYGSIKIYAYSLFFWSLFTLLHGFVFFAPAMYIVISLALLQFFLGVAEAPAFPANTRIVATWFPTKERATAASIFNASQYFSLAVFSPVLSWITYNFSWQYVFIVMGLIGFIFSLIWIMFVRNPLDHNSVSAAELDYIEQGGAMIHMDKPKAKNKSPSMMDLKRLITNRTMFGIFLSQYFLNTITWFFLVWFPIYLVQAKGFPVVKAGLVAAIPAIFGFSGGILGGVFSDFLLKKGFSLTVARKVPIIIGMLLAACIVLCNYTANNTVIIILMALAFFGKGFGALGFPVITDTAPKEMVGLCAGIFNVFGNIAPVVTPLVIGTLVKETHSFNAALIYVSCSALMSMFCYLFVVKDIKRFEIQ